MMHRRRLALAVLGALAVLALTALLAGTPRPPLVEIIPGPPQVIVAPTVDSSEPPAHPGLEFDLPEGDPFTMPSWLPSLLRTLAVGVALLLVALFLHRLWRARIRLNSATAGAPSGDGVEVADLDEDELAEAVVDTVEQLRRGIPVSGAVIDCWRRLERLAAATGITRSPTQTSHEFTLDVLNRTSAHPAAITELAQLYREAMFSTHQLTDADRDRALACLEQLRAQLTEAR